MRIRPRRIGAMHHAIARQYDRRRADGTRVLERPAAAFRFLAYHADLAESLVAPVGLLEDILADERLRAAQRLSLRSFAPGLMDLRRGVASAVRAGALDGLAIALVRYADDEFESRSGLTRWREVMRERRGEELLRLTGDARRPDIASSILHWFCVFCSSTGGSDPTLEEHVRALDISAEGPWWALARSLRSALEGAPAPVRRAEAPGDKSLMLDGSTNAGTSRWEGLDVVERGRAVNALGSTLRGLDGKANRQRIRDAADMLEGALTASLSDVERRAIVEAFSPELRIVFASVEVDLLQLSLAFLDATSSDYHGSVSACVRASMGLVNGERERFETSRTIVSRLMRLREPQYRGTAAGAVLEGLARSIEEYGVSSEFEDELDELVSLEAAAVHRPNGDFVRFGLARRSWALDRPDVVGSVLQRIESPWVRGQVIRQAPLEALGRHPCADLLALVSNPLACVFALVRVVEARGDRLTPSELALVFEKAKSDESEFVVLAVDALARHWATRSEGVRRFDRLWRELEEAIRPLRGEFAWRVVDGVAAGWEALPSGFRSWAAERMEEAPLPRRGSWPNPDAATNFAPLAARVEPFDAVAVALRSSDATTAVAVLRSWGIGCVDWWRAVNSEDRGKILTLVGPGPLTPDSCALILRLATGNGAIDTANWAPAHIVAFEVAIAPLTLTARVSEIRTELAEALLECWAGTDDREPLLAGAVTLPVFRAAIRRRADEYREFDLGRTTALVASQGRPMLVRLAAEFFRDSFEGRGDASSRKPTAQRLCAEAVARFATPREFDVLVSHFAPTAENRDVP
jgi:hypothetical protein